MRKDNQLTEEFLSVSDVAQLCRVTPQTVRDWQRCRDGFPCAYQPGGPGGRLLFKRAEILDFVNGTRQPSADEYGPADLDGLEDVSEPKKNERDPG